MTPRVFVFALSFGLGNLAVQALIPAATPRVAAAARASSVQTPGATASKADCLSCHSYDDVVAATASHVMPSGEKVSPHRYVDATAGNEPAGQPHQATGTENIPECSHCHTPHAVPPTDKVDRSMISVQWCYSSCHHQSDFTLCGTCHNN